MKGTEAGSAAQGQISYHHRTVNKQFPSGNKLAGLVSEKQKLSAVDLSE